MKTAEVEIGKIVAKVVVGDILLLEAASRIQDQIELIKLDAYKQGMTDAADFASGNPCKQECRCVSCNIHKNILTARDNKTTI